MVWNFCDYAVVVVDRAGLHCLCFCFISAVWMLDYIFVHISAHIISTVSVCDMVQSVKYNYVLYLVDF